MATANYVLLEKITVGAAGASSVTFNSIPQTGYTDLVVKVSARTNRTGTDVDDELFVEFNGSGGTAYSTRMIEGNGSTVRSASDTSQAKLTRGLAPTDNSTANTFSNCEYYIPNYTGSAYKSVSFDNVMENNATYSLVTLSAGLWSNTAAITSIKLTGIGTFEQYSTFYLYGVAKLGTTPAIVPYATGGDTIMTDGTYWYHTFTSSGTFTPQKSLSCDYLVVAGGGGGGRNQGGGGGAGGLRSTVTATGGGGSLETALSLGTSAYTVTVGAGGNGSTNDSLAGGNGSNSVFASITSTGGGGGGSTNGSPVANKDGQNGGSGGGESGSGALVGTGTTNQGFAGSDGANNGSNRFNGGGGGGAGVVATAATTSVTGAGGNGVATSISGSSVTYAGGGSGGAYQGNVGVTIGAAGTGGGGAGNIGTTSQATAGTANTGGGGGGGGATNAGAAASGGNGGSGIVVIRYAV